MGNVKKLKRDNFDEFISKGNIIIDFSAKWCMPCKILKPIFHEVAGEFKDINFGEVDVDSSSELTQKMQIFSVPTIIFFKNKEQIERVGGTVSKEKLIEIIKKAFKN